MQINCQGDPFAGGHGIDLDSSDVGLTRRYVDEIVENRPRRIVVLGSGTALVPILLRRTQESVCQQASETWLVDSCDPTVGFGGPWDALGWLTNSSRLRSPLVDLRLFLGSSYEASAYFSRNRLNIDLLFVDADHSRSGVTRDLLAYQNQISVGGSIILHDANSSQIIEALEDSLHLLADFEIEWSDAKGAGALSLRRRK